MCRFERIVCLCYFFIAVIIPERKNLKKKLFILAHGFHSLLQGRPWWRGLPMVASKQRKNTCVPTVLFSSVFHPGFQLVDSTAPFQGRPSSLVSLWKHPPRQPEEFVPDLLGISLFLGLFEII